MGKKRNLRNSRAGCQKYITAKGLSKSQLYNSWSSLPSLLPDPQPYEDKRTFQEPLVNSFHEHFLYNEPTFYFFLMRERLNKQSCCLNKLHYLRRYMPQVVRDGEHVLLVNFFEEILCSKLVSAQNVVLFPQNRDGHAF